MTYKLHSPWLPGLVRCGAKALCGAGAAAMLTACAAMADDQKTTKAAENYPVPPEFINCKDVPAALAQADAIVRKLGLYSTTREGAYWAKRQERLVARAYQCKGN